MTKKHPTVSTYSRTPFDYVVVGPDVAYQARAAADRIRGHEKAAAVEIGRELNAVKDALGHGHFLQWVEAEFGFSRRTATNLMLVATEFGDKWALVSHLPPTVLYQLAAPSTPPAIRDAVLHTEPGKFADPKAIKHLIADARKKEFRREQKALREAEAAEPPSDREKRLAKRLAAEQAERDAAMARAVEVAETIAVAFGERFVEVHEKLAAISAWDLHAALTGVRA